MVYREPFSIRRVKPTRVLALTLFGLIALAGCGDSPTSSTGGGTPTPPITLQSLTVTGELEVEQGMQSQLATMANFSDGRNRDVTTQASYTSGDDSVVTVNGNGLMTGVAPGTTTVTASYEEGGVRRQGEVDVMVAREVAEFRVTLTVSSIRIIEDCDPGPIIQTGPGEFTYRVTTRFPADSGDITLREGTNRTSRNNGQSITIDRQRVATIRGDSASVRVVYRLTEWDASTPDSRMNNRAGNRTHTLSNGQWSGAGSNSVTIGSGSCRAQLNYTFNTTRTN